MANDWSANLLPSPSTTSNLKAKVPPCSPGAWLYSMCPIKRKRKTKQTNKKQDLLLVLFAIYFWSERWNSRWCSHQGLGFHLPHLAPFWRWNLKFSSLLFLSYYHLPHILKPPHNKFPPSDISYAQRFWRTYLRFQDGLITTSIIRMTRWVKLHMCTTCTDHSHIIWRDPPNTHITRQESTGPRSASRDPFPPHSPVHGRPPATGVEFHLYFNK